MAHSASSTSTRLAIVIAISFAFFLAELIGFRTQSLALIADAFHYLNDLIAFFVALLATQLSGRKHAPPSLTFGWQRAKVLGAFFNGAFLIALGLSIFLQAMERFIYPEVIQHPRNVLIMGCIGILVNVTCILAVHDHHHHHGPKAESKPGDPVLEVSDLETQLKTKHVHHDLGLSAVVIHILGDVLNNLGVIAAALVMMLISSPARFYADPAISVGIAIMISCSAIPLTFRSGHILLGSTPPSAQHETVMQALNKLPGVVSVHDLCVWQLSQEDLIASAHIVMSPLTNEETASRDGSEAELLTSNEGAGEHVETVNERLARLGRCLHEFGIYKMTLQIEDASTKDM